MQGRFPEGGLIPLAVSRMCKSRFAEHLFTFLPFYSFTFKQVLFAHKRSLVCNEKKPCLHSKQGFFENGRNNNRFGADFSQYNNVILQIEVISYIEKTGKYGSQLHLDSVFPHSLLHSPRAARLHGRHRGVSGDDELHLRHDIHIAAAGSLLGVSLHGGVILVVRCRRTVCQTLSAVLFFLSSTLSIMPYSLASCAFIQ